MKKADDGNLAKEIESESERVSEKKGRKSFDFAIHKTLQQYKEGRRKLKGIQVPIKLIMLFKTLSEGMKGKQKKRVSDLFNERNMNLNGI